MLAGTLRVCRQQSPLKSPSTPAAMAKRQFGKMWLKPRCTAPNRIEVRTSAAVPLRVQSSIHFCNSPRKKNSSDKDTTQRIPKNCPNPAHTFGFGRRFHNPSPQSVAPTTGSISANHLSPARISAPVGTNRNSVSTPPRNTSTAIAHVRISIRCPSVENGTLGRGDR